MRKSRKRQDITEAGAQEAADLNRRLTESIATYFDNFVDPLDALRDDDTGELWQVVGDGDVKGATGILNEERLRAIRNECRSLAELNEYAINGHENRISYIVGSGHAYTVQAKEGREVSDADIERAQAVIDDFIDANNWNNRQQEIVLRKDRDGECFLRFFSDSTIRVRFIEPSQVATPQGKVGVPEYSWGIHTDPEDVETVLGYWVDGEELPAGEVQHRKLGVDANVKRGLPLFYPVRKNLRRAEKLLRNMTVVAEIQSAIAMIRKHTQATQSTVQAMITANADASVTNNRTGKTTDFRQYGPGTILDTSQGTEYEFPTQAIDSTRYVQVLQAELRAVASRLVMPEFMLTSDASNANYSSTMVAEGPAVKMFQRLQWDMIQDDRAVMDAVLSHAGGVGRISEAVVENIEVDVQPPRLETRNRKEETESDCMLVDKKVMSKRTAALRADLDPDSESEQIEKETESSMANNPFAGMQPGQPPQVGGSSQGDDDEEEEDT